MFKDPLLLLFILKSELIVKHELRKNNKNRTVHILYLILDRKNINALYPLGQSLSIELNKILSKSLPAH